MSSMDAASGPENHHFSNRNRAFREFHRQNSSPWASKTRCAESVTIVVVGLAYTACIIFSHFYIFFHKFSRNALKRILLENQSLSMANANCVFVQDWSSKTAFLRVNGEWVHFDNFAPRLSKTTHRALQQLFESLFWTIFFLKSWCKSYSKMYYFAQVGHKNHCCGKADFLKFYRFSYHFLKIESVFLHHFLIPN